MQNKSLNFGACFLYLAVIIACFISCDILRLSPFEVSKWGPGGGRHDDPDSISVFLKFSHKPDKSSVENNFSFLEDGMKVQGLMQWNDRILKFFPLAPLEKGRDYTIELSADACDTNGLSMDRTFEGRFSTRVDDTRPRLLCFFPEMNGIIEGGRSPVRLTFSRNVLLSSLRDYVSFSPVMSGIWHFEDTEAVFTPLEPWSRGKRYEMRISGSLQGDNGVAIGGEHLSVFFVGTDIEKPELINTWRISENGQRERLVQDVPNVFFENSGWERTDRLCLEFSKPVDSLSVRNCLDAAGVSPPAMETPGGYASEIVFMFEKAPVYNARFSLTLKRGVKDIFGNESENNCIFKIHADGAHSKPPSLVGIRIPMSPGNESDQELMSYEIDSLFADLPIMDGGGKYPYTKETETWIECYFDTAVGAKINNFSLMEFFRINTSNNALNFSPRGVNSGNFFTSAPHPGWESYQRVEIRGMLINTVNSGVVYIEILPGLADCNGNRTENSMCISLLK